MESMYYIGLDVHKKTAHAPLPKSVKFVRRCS
jgi:hypothetical protein